MRVIGLAQAQYTEDAHSVKLLNAGDVITTNAGTAIELMKKGAAVQVPDDANVTHIAYFIKFAKKSAAADFGRYGKEIVKDMIKELG